jgi:2-polyprenyl-6-hydroxyphenyl methylase/3-demethylubiquinone-9 3-methyltransferase
MSYKSTIDNNEIDHFAKDSKDWWNKNGPFKQLHKLNSTRILFIEDQIYNHYEQDQKAKPSLKGLNILDIGCGGGLICEPLALNGAYVTGLDADSQAIEVAREHAKNNDINITYINENLQALKGKYDVVLALEIIEHVSDVQSFIEQCANVLKPNGLLIISTPNRTAKSYALGIIAAEHILHWVPKGTHSWNKFVKPSELVHYAQTYELCPIYISGLIYNPLKNKYTLSENNTDMNYLISFKLKS